MKSALIVSNSEKSNAFFAENIPKDICENITTVKSFKDAKNVFLENSYDLLIINAPLKDKTGETFAKYAALKGKSQIILLADKYSYEETLAATQDYGVVTLAKPIDKKIFSTVLICAQAAYRKINLISKQNNLLIQKIEDIRIIDRAKCLLISYLGISEEEAHKYIERWAMDTRSTKRAIGETILKTYEN